MQITIDTNHLSELDVNMLAFLAENGAVAEEVEEAPEPVKAAKAAKAEAPPAKQPKAKKAEPEPEPEDEDEDEDEDDEDLVGNEPDLSDAIARATELVSKGETKRVKTALDEVGAKKVSDLDGKQIAAFLAALEE